MKLTVPLATVVVVIFSLSACSSNSSNPGPLAALSGQDAGFITGATQASNAEISAAKLALTKTTNPDVISFANLMITQHTQEEQALAPIGTAVGDPIPPPTSINATQQKQAATLQATPEPAFDGVYINGEIAGHQMNIANNFQPEISGGTNPSVVNYAKTYLPQVQMHLQMAQQIKAKYGF